MPSILVCGGGPIGLVAALMLARDGHDVTVLEADPEPGPGTATEAWEDWRRPGVAQFHQPHALLSRFREVCRAELPDVLDRLLAAGCAEIALLTRLPPAITDQTPREGDERLRVLAGRRPVLENVIAGAAAEQPGLTIRRGVRVAALLPGPFAIPGVPHASGAVTTDGEQIPADLVVDASGRRTVSARWLTGLGARAPVIEASDRSFTYYSRFFTGGGPRPLRGPAFTSMGSMGLLALEGDAGTWSLTLFTRSADLPLKTLRFPAVFDRVVRACPVQDPRAEGEPITDVLPMAGVLNTLRRFVVDGRPVVTGFAALADAWACTNPSGGRGLSIGLLHARTLRRVARAHVDDPAAFADAWHRATEEIVTPFFRLQEKHDRQVMAEMTAAADGVEPPRPDPLTARFEAAAWRDADVFRAALEIGMCLATAPEVLARPLIRQRMEELGSSEDEPGAAPGPDRAELLRLLAV